MYKKVIIPVFFVFLSHFVFGQSAPKYSNDFLSIGIGARSLGMSNSVIASEFGTTSGYHNPSGLLLSDKQIEIAAMHAEYFAGISKYDYLSCAYRIDTVSSVGFSVIRLGVDNIPNTLELFDNNGLPDYTKIKYFSDADYAFLFSYARKTKITGLRVGGNVKVIYRKIGDFASAIGFGLDAGIQYDKNQWRFGATLRDATSTFNAWSFETEQLEDVFLQTGNEVPENSVELTLPKLIIGAGRYFKLSEKFGAYAELDADFTFDGKRNVLLKSDAVSVDPHLGVELNYDKMIFVRGGVGSMQEITDFDGKSFEVQPSLGIGLKLWNFTIDYALTSVGDEFFYSNIFSLKYSFNRK